VKANQKAFEEVKKDLSTGIYYEDLNNGYCRQIYYDAADLQSVRGPEDLPVDRARYMKIRKMSDSGSYSSVTKLFIKPSIPFEIEFNGRKHKITVMTLMHPSPIRVENVQHDAMLTLGDPGEGNNDGLVVLIPLQGSLTAGDSGQFIGKIARYMTGILQPDPATGDYQSIDIPTGNDWALSKMFKGSPGEDGKTVVTQPGYYVWSGTPPLELRQVRRDNVPDSFWYKWWYITYYLRQPDNAYFEWLPKYTNPVRYVMLSQAAPVSSFDLQTIRMLPVTPTTEAVAPILKWTLSYRRAGSPGPNGEWVSSCPTPSVSGAITSLFSSRREGMENPIDTCDPFASIPAKPDSTEAFIQVVIGIFTAIAVGLAIYLAVLFFTKTKWGRWVANQGTIAGNKVSQAFVSDSRAVIPVNPLFDTKLAEAEDKAKEAEETRKKVEDEKRIAKEKAKEGAEAMAKEKEDAAAAEAAKKDAEHAKRKKKLEAYKARRGIVSGPVRRGPETAVVEAKTPEGAAEIAEAGKEAEAEAEKAIADAGKEAEEKAKLEEKRRVDALLARIPEESKIPEDVTEEELRVMAESAPAPEGPEPPHRRGRSEDRMAAIEAKKKEAVAAATEAKKEESAAAATEAKKEESAAAAAGTGLSKDEAKVVAAVGEEAKKDEEAEKEKAQTERLRKEAEELKAMFAAAKKRKEEAAAAERAAAETKDEAEIAKEEASEKPKPRVRQASKSPAPPPLASLRAERKEAEKEVAKVETQLADTEAERKKQEEIAKAAEEAAKSASKAAERQTANLATPIMKKRPIQSSTRALVPPSAAAKPAGHPPPTEEEVKGAVETFIADTKPATVPAAKTLAKVEKKELTEEQRKAVTDELNKIRDDLIEHMKNARRNTELTAGLWPNQTAWLRFEQEKKRHGMYVKPAVKKLMTFKEKIETSGLDALRRPPYDSVYASYLQMVVKLVKDSQDRIQNVTRDAPPPRVVFGGRRRKMKRKSTRRYVA
jgi:hypothetical protein